VNYQVMPSLTSVEFEGLKEDIAQHGVLVPVEVDERGNILDGHHRIRAWQELREEGVTLPDYPRMIRSGMTEEAKRNHARRLNVMRRQLTREQRDDVMRAMRADGMTYQDIAKAVGVSVNTAHRAASKVELFDSKKLPGADGKYRPASYAPRPTPPPSLFVPGGAVQLDPVAVSTAIETVRLEVAQRRAEREQVREERRQANAEVVAATPDPVAAGARFATILIDPPWDWGDEGDVNQLGRAKPDYATMPFEDLLKLPVNELADVDCHLYLWITNRSLPKGFSLMEAWGFRYVTCVTWVKPSFGMGNYFRGQTEHMLFGVRGSQPLLRKNAGTVFHAQRGDGGHSSKPVEAYELIESCSPGPYLEMFARRKRDGWVGWGADA